jgi:hypothetical protein
MGEAALRCFMCKGENTIVGAIVHLGPLHGENHLSLNAQEGYLMVLLPFVAPDEYGELLKGGEKVPPSIYKVKKNQNNSPNNINYVLHELALIS